MFDRLIVVLVTAIAGAGILAALLYLAGVRF